ncbi:MAG: hypothetical protein BVN34_02130 [Proteobacteria bacterium ST_bin12]|nr:MAG: hypothetical protein BVN34_02130 [Proteobacteria bacterium ST_bin12]
MEDIIKQAPGQAGSDGHPYKRLRRIEIRASNQEYHQLRDYAHSAQYSNLAQYLREAGLSNKEIQSQTKKMEALRACQYELNKIGVNINQISHHLNANPDNPITEETLLVLMQIQELADSIYQSSKAKQ